ncbi:hypothetical protein KHP62_18495 [Rhodobacteraceae bacterium NNCM2]|nr:hypothetical protein [Coraliihabitans acroporae]
MNLQASEGLEQFASAGLDFTISSIILAVLAASLTQSLYDLGLRRLFHGLWVWSWVRQRDGDWANWREGTKNGRLYTLHYQQLCGQISSFIQFELDEPGNWLLLPSMASRASLDQLARAEGVERDRARQRVNAEAEDALDDLQTLLSNRSRVMYYLLCLLFSFGIVMILTTTDNQFTAIEGTEISLIYIGLVAGLMGPIFRNLIERLLTAG